MHWGVVGSALRVWFVVDDGRGTLKTGIVPGDFTVTVVAPDDSATSAPSVSESTQKPGLYQFDVSGAFLTTHGAGNYATSVEINVAAPKFDAVSGPVLKVDQSTIDDIGVKLTEVHETMGLEVGKEMVVNPTSRKVPADGSLIEQTIDTVDDEVTVRRV